MSDDLLETMGGPAMKVALAMQEEAERTQKLLERIATPPPNPVLEIANQNSASEFHRRLVEWINEFDQRLDQQHDVGVRLVSFGRETVFHLEDLGYWNPSLLVFFGRTEEGDPVELIQHVTQISVLLVKLPRANPDEPKQPIGFHGLPPE